MIALIAALHVALPAGSMFDGLQGLSDLAFREGYQFTFESAPFVGLDFPGLECECTLEEAIRRIVGPLPVEISDIGGDTWTLARLPGYCWPEMGAEAPLPPCIPRPLSMRGVRSSSPPSRSDTD